ISDVTQQICDILEYASLASGMHIASGFFFPSEREISKEYAEEMSKKYRARVENVCTDKKVISNAADVNRWLNDVDIESGKNYAEACLQHGLDTVLLSLIDIRTSLPRGVSKKIEFRGRRCSLALKMFSFRKVIPYYEDEYVQMVGIPLNADTSFRMFVILPKQANRFEQYENFMTGKKIVKLLSSMWYHKVEVSIPKFNISDQHDLTEKLEHLQIPEMIGSEKHFQRISEEPFNSLLILHSVRLSFVETMVMDDCEEESDVDNAPPLSFVADSPFLYLMTRNQTVVLVGRVEP
uniref:Serpin domain-containing protein n=1 Tax=Parascaris univalens TaxID=6257 RepID=A0A915A4C3_PARUN